VVEVGVARVQGDGRGEVCDGALKVAHAVLGDAAVVVGKAVGGVYVQRLGVVLDRQVVLAKLRGEKGEAGGGSVGRRDKGRKGKRESA
jgi:hypothetical protein